MTDDRRMDLRVKVMAHGYELMAAHAANRQRIEIEEIESIGCWPIWRSVLDIWSLDVTFRAG
jgi:hypothetical protein